MDIIDVIEAVAENTAFGGNAETYDAAYLYETGAHVAGEEDETIKYNKMRVGTLRKMLDDKGLGVDGSRESMIALLKENSA